jgi:hypothetical protein
VLNREVLYRIVEKYFDVVVRKFELRVNYIPGWTSIVVLIGDRSRLKKEL